MPMTFAKPALIMINDKVLSDHNRSDLATSWEIIETKKRMADATMRKYHVATKNNFDVSWKDLPHTAFHTVDGHYGALNMRDYLLANTGSLTLTVRYDDADEDVYTVMLKDFDMSLSKRGKYDMYDVSLSLEEV